MPIRVDLLLVPQRMLLLRVRRFLLARLTPAGRQASQLFRGALGRDHRLTPSIAVRATVADPSGIQRRGRSKACRPEHAISICLGPSLSGVPKERELGIR
jgi:hypothetical protein